MKVPHYKMNLRKYIQDTHNTNLNFSIMWLQTDSVHPFQSDGSRSNCKKMLDVK